jgi:hypothetical protein
VNEHRAATRGDTPDAVALWASARVTELLVDQHQPVPAYGTREWQQLDSNDPRKAAAILTAAESWRRFGHEDLSVIEAAEMWRRYGSEVVQWFKEASTPHAPIAERKTVAELEALAKPKPARPVQASEGWPPVAIPGRPGWYRCLVDGRQVDVQKRQVAA